MNWQFGLVAQDNDPNHRRNDLRAPADNGVSAIRRKLFSFRAALARLPTGIDALRKARKSSSTKKCFRRP
jgi:hypothetical protein